jgi:hypothetical protein
MPAASSTAFFTLIYTEDIPILQVWSSMRAVAVGSCSRPIEINLHLTSLRRNADNLPVWVSDMLAALAVRNPNVVFVVSAASAASGAGAYTEAVVESTHCVEFGLRSRWTGSG